MSTVRETQDQLLQALADTSPIGIFLVQDKKFCYVNAHVCRFTGYSNSDLVGLDSLSIVHPDDVAKVQKNAVEMLEGTRTFPYDYRIITSRGDTHWIVETVASVVYQGARATFGNFLDITEEKQIEERLNLLQSLTDLINAAPNAETALGGALDSICRFTGWSAGRAWLVEGDKLVSGPTTQSPNPQIRSFLSTGRDVRVGPGESIVGTAWLQREPLWIEDLSLDESFNRKQEALEAGLKSALAIPVVTANQVLAVLVFFLAESTGADRRLLDLVSALTTQLGSVIRQKQVEGALRQSEERVRQILHTANEAFVATDDRGVITDWNPQAETTFGWSKQEAVGQSLIDTIIPPQYHDAHTAGLSRYLETGDGPVLNTPLELTALHRDGREFPVEFTISPLMLGDKLTFNAFLRDISERRRMDLELRETAADLGRKNADLEAFTYSISHDLKEPLRALEGFSQYLMTNYAAEIDDRGRDLLQRIANASLRMKNLIDDLLALSRAGRDGLPQESTSVGNTISEILEALAPLIQERGAVVQVGTMPVVIADRPRLEQVLHNLITNGLKFNTGDHPAVDIGVHTTDGDRVTVYVKDNGIGIDPEYHDKVFGLFQRLHTRDEFEGNGAGLAIVKRAVEALGGRIWLDSEKGQGTTFFVELILDPSAVDDAKQRLVA